MTDFSDLSSLWMKWASLAQIPGASAVTDPIDCVARFISDDQSFNLREDGTWWILDEVDDRGKEYVDTARFSTFNLAEKYLMWRWASFARSALGLPALGPQLYKQGYSGDVVVSPTNDEWRTSVTDSTGSAILPQPDSTIFSHLMSKSMDEIDRFVGQGFT